MKKIQFVLIFCFFFGRREELTFALLFRLRCRLVDNVPSFNGRFVLMYALNIWLWNVEADGGRSQVLVAERREQLAPLNKWIVSFASDRRRRRREPLGRRTSKSVRIVRRRDLRHLFKSPSCWCRWELDCTRKERETAFYIRIIQKKKRTVDCGFMNASLESRNVLSDECHLTPARCCVAFLLSSFISSFYFLTMTIIIIMIIIISFILIFLLSLLFLSNVSFFIGFFFPSLWFDFF